MPFGENFEGTKVTLSAKQVTIKHRTPEGQSEVSRFEIRGGQFEPVE